MTALAFIISEGLWPSTQLRWFCAEILRTGRIPWELIPADKQHKLYKALIKRGRALEGANEKNSRS